MMLNYLLRTSFLFIALLIAGISFAQQQQYNFSYRQNVNFLAGTDTLSNALSGGFNAPMFSKTDLNNDSVPDLIVFDRTSSKVFTYLAINQSGQWEWQYVPDYEALFPEELKSFLVMHDFNCDGLEDIFTLSEINNLYNIGVYKQQIINGQVAFVKYTSSLGYTIYNPLTGQNQYNTIEIDYHSMPAFSDIDNDGDLDILAFEIDNGNFINYYKNQRVENNLHCDSLTFFNDGNAWGGIHKCMYSCGNFTFGNQCPVGPKVAHGEGYSLLALDLDNDGDKDLLFGEENCNDLVRLTNNGTPVLASMNTTSVSAPFPTGTTPASFPIFPLAYYQDVTFDGAKDLLVSPFLEGNNSYEVNMEESSWLYENTGSNQLPVFSFETKSFLQTLDLGEDTAPAFADIDSDGDLDLVVGNYASNRYNSYTGSLALLRNIGSVNQPVFQLEDTDYLNFSTENFKNIAPTFADLNGDGALDLVFSTLNPSGSMNVIYNTAPAGQPFQFNKNNRQKFLKFGYNINENPVFYDLDNDSDLDLLIGKANGTIAHFRNSGSATAPAWDSVTATFGNIPVNHDRGHLSLAIADLDQDSVPELITADNMGEIRVYRNFTDNLTATLVPEPGAYFNNVLQADKQFNLGTDLYLAAANIDSDPRAELVIGSRTGGLQIISYTDTSAITVPMQPTQVKPQLAALSGISIYPNPASGQVSIEAKEAVSVTIYDLAGKSVLENKNKFSQNLMLDISGIQPGMYLVQLQSKDGRSTTKRLVIQR